MTGRPGSGKTTLAPLLSSELAWPLVSRDKIKEAMLETLGIGVPVPLPLHEVEGLAASGSGHPDPDPRKGLGVGVFVQQSHPHPLPLPPPGAQGEGVNARATDAFFAQVSRLAHQGSSLVAEAAFQHKVWAPRLALLAEVADVRVVVCEVPPDIAWSRRQERAGLDPHFAARHPDPPGHLGEREPYDPPSLPLPTLRVSTLEGYAPGLAEIVAFLG
ncbi:MAG: AAA family ATPase [Trueperaceae bacterium]